MICQADPNRPLILIGHSFGGLVILRLLTEAHHEPTRWPGIYDSASGLVFLGTPFRGTDDSLSQGDILRYAQAHFTESPVYVRNLEVFRAEGEQIGDLLETYLRIARHQKMPRMACFYEQLPSKVGGILGPGVGKVLCRPIFTYRCNLPTYKRTGHPTRHSCERNIGMSRYDVTQHRKVWTAS